MSNCLTATVKSNQPMGPGVYLLILEAPAIATAAQPGQFVMLRVSPGPEPLLARPFSVHGVEGGRVLILYQVVGKGTALLKEVVEGQELVMWGPLGRGFELSGQRPALVGGGIGIAPLAFAAERLSKEVDEVSLFYGLPGSTGLDPLMELFEQRLDPVKVALSFSTEDGSLGKEGLVTFLLQDSLSLPVAERPDAVLACGPMPMLKAVAAMCAEYEAPCQVSLEAPMACGVGACLGCAVPAAGGGYARACAEGPVMDAALIDWGRMGP